MLIRHPMSFWLAITVVVVTAALCVAWNTIHVVFLVVDIFLVGGLRDLAIREGRSELETKSHVS